MTDLPASIAKKSSLTTRRAVFNAIIKNYLDEHVIPQAKEDI